MLEPPKIGEVAASWAREFPLAEGVVITGDVSRSDRLVEDLKVFQASFGKKVYFVLGNHDYYGSSFEEVEKSVSEIQNPDIIYLHNRIVPLSQEVALVGVNGWYDAEFGQSSNLTNDFYKIANLKGKDPVACSKLRSADMADLIQELVEKARVKGYKRIAVATHIPPFEQLAKKHGEVSPWYGSYCMGVALVEAAAHADEMIVMCGHSHERGFLVAAKNVFAYSGISAYGRPDVSGVLDVANFEMFMFK